ncbi:MAG: hypothetical protein H5T86_08910 [Armatimonadetes bacterium]|nr:hypothetical protein [Armatimonadota bacterium]
MGTAWALCVLICIRPVAQRLVVLPPKGDVEIVLPSICIEPSKPAPRVKQRYYVSPSDTSAVVARLTSMASMLANNPFLRRQVLESIPEYRALLTWALFGQWLAEPYQKGLAEIPLGPRWREELEASLAMAQVITTPGFVGYAAQIAVWSETGTLKLGPTRGGIPGLQDSVTERQRLSEFVQSLAAPLANFLLVQAGSQRDAMDPLPTASALALHSPAIRVWTMCQPAQRVLHWARKCVELNNPCAHGWLTVLSEFCTEAVGHELAKIAESPQATTLIQIAEQSKRWTTVASILGSGEGQRVEQVQTTLPLVAAFVARAAVRGEAGQAAELARRLERPGSEWAWLAKATVYRLRVAETTRAHVCESYSPLEIQARLAQELPSSPAVVLAYAFWQVRCGAYKEAKDTVNRLMNMPIVWPETWMAVAVVADRTGIHEEAANIWKEHVADMGAVTTWGGTG